MFFPLGLGGLPRKFPFITVLIALVSVFWSNAFYEIQSAAQSEINTIVTNNNIEKLVAEVRFEVCLSKFQAPKTCAKLFQEQTTLMPSNSKPDKSNRDVASENTEPASEKTENLDKRKSMTKSMEEHFRNIEERHMEKVNLEVFNNMVKWGSSINLSNKFR